MKYILLNFKKSPDADLLLFGSDVVANMKGNARYDGDDLQAQVLAVELSLSAFQTAANNASDGGSSLIQTRREKRKVLENDLTILAKLLELHTNEDITYFTEAGFRVRKQPERHLGPLPRPVMKYARQGVMSGSIDGESDDFPDGVKQIAVEYSPDNGQSWHNGTYSTGKRFTMDNLTPRAEYLLRVCYQGTRQRVSDWSEPLGLFVL
jgi:hypothetical protein